MPPRQIVFSGDRHHLWSYARAGILTILLVCILGVGISLIRRASAAWYMYPVALFVVTGFFGVVYSVICLRWKSSVLPVSYLLDEGALVARRGESELQRISRSNIADFEIVGRMDYLHMGTQFRYIPKWPFARVTVRDGTSCRTVDFPQIMLWGTACARVQEEIRKELGI